eukprot:g8164.t1
MSGRENSEADVNKEVSGRGFTSSKDYIESRPYSPCEANVPDNTQEQRLLRFPVRLYRKLKFKSTTDIVKDKGIPSSQGRLMRKGRGNKESSGPSNQQQREFKSQFGILRNLNYLRSCFPCCRMTGMTQDGVNAAQGGQFEILDKVDSWDNFDVFELENITSGHPLEVLFMDLLEKFNLISNLKLDKEKCKKYCRKIESLYNQANPYHNRIHAADVLQSVAVMLFTDQFHKEFTDIEILSMLMSATIHDVEHPGVTNHYHIRKQTNLAIKYNDKSVNENMHVTRAYEILLRDEDHMLNALSRDDYMTLRTLIINTVLSTDMAGHNALVDRFSKTFPCQNGFTLSSMSFKERDLLIQMIVHCADISNPTRPWKHSHKWSEKITEEMHLQGDKEKAMGWKPMALFDRRRSNIYEDQLYFLNIFVCPCFERFASVAPGFVKIALDYAEENKRNWGTKLHENGPEIPPNGTTDTTTISCSSSQEPNHSLQ